MKVLVVISALIAGICADADALYGAYGAYGGAALGYPYAYARGYARPAVAAAHVVAAPAVRTIAAPAVAAVHTVAAPAVAAVHTVAAPAVRTIAAPAVRTVAAPVIAKAAHVVAEVRAAVPTVTSTQFHSQDEEKNFAFGYSNINSARQESGNALTGVTGSYSDGFRTYNYVADGLGFRHI